jgi:hypothetical protein
MKDAAYEERYCAYIDILGFDDLMADLRSGNVKFETIRDVLKRIHKPYIPKLSRSNTVISVHRAFRTRLRYRPNVL